MARLTITAILALLLAVLAHSAAGARVLAQTVAGTNIKAVDTTRRTGTGAVSQQVQTNVRQGGTTDIKGQIARTQAAGRASQSTRTAVGNNRAQAAVQQAVRTNNAQAGTQAGAGITAATVHGRGQHISSSGARAQKASTQTQAAIQAAARGQTSAGSATRTGQQASRAAMMPTSFPAGTPIGRR